LCNFFFGQEDDWITTKEPNEIDMSEWFLWVVVCQKLQETESITLVPIKDSIERGLDLNELKNKLITYFLSKS
tara:strand:- start:552 stop:770 length:219 start_codon:yes stop_codon:yes gene_type:complete